MPYADEEIAFVLENLQVPQEEMPPLIRRYLAMVGLQLDDVHFPISQLSQGMKQRLAIASVLALEPDVLFLDEPTALLDEEGTRHVWDTIRAISADKTLVIVEHKITGILDFVDRVVIMDPEGQILADGPPQAVFQANKPKLIEYGIWYPGVWDDYETADRGNRSKRSVPNAGESETLLELERFQMIRGGEIKVRADHLSVHPGEWIAVTGSNGAGKSTLLLALMGLIKTKGAYKVKGVTSTKVEQLAEKIAFVFQNPEFQFVTHTVEDELAYSLPEGAAERNGQTDVVESLLRQYDLAPFRKRHPFQLSTGQKRRLSVASAMVGKQRILLLDEPTFGLDARNTFMMLERLEQMRANGTAIIMVTHDPDIVRNFATRVWRIERGEVIVQIGQTAPERRDGGEPAI
jgi:energy-coupling factor transport system ATP-binding protein